MSLPAALADLLQIAAKEVAGDPCGALTLQCRHDICVALGAYRPRGSGAIRGVGLRRRFNLAARCVRHVLPLWKAKLPEDKTPQRLLAGAETHLGKRFTYEQAKALIDEGWVHADDVGCEFGDRKDPEGFRVALVCYAASRAVSVAFRDERYHLLVDPASGGKYGSGDPESMDVAYLAAAAISGGFPNPKGLGTEARREYWRWYLRQAVPAAFASAK
jgi:hypothetical protein